MTRSSATWKYGLGGSRGYVSTLDIPGTWQLKCLLFSPSGLNVSRTWQPLNFRQIIWSSTVLFLGAYFMSLVCFLTFKKKSCCVLRMAVMSDDIFLVYTCWWSWDSHWINAADLRPIANSLTSRWPTPMEFTRYIHSRMERKVNFNWRKMVKVKASKFYIKQAARLKICFQRNWNN